MVGDSVSRAKLSAGWRHYRAEEGIEAQIFSAAGEATVRNICIAALLRGCQSEAARAIADGADATVRAERVASTRDRGNCGADVRPTLIGMGIDEFRVGRPAAEIAAPCVVLADAVAPGPEAIPQRVMSIPVAGTDTVLATIVNYDVWRLQLESTAIRTVDSLGVGSLLAERLRSWRGRARSAEGEGRLFVLLEEPGGVSFRVNFAFGVMQHRAEWRAEDRAGLVALLRVLQRRCGRRPQQRSFAHPFQTHAVRRLQRRLVTSGVARPDVARLMQPFRGGRTPRLYDNRRSPAMSDRLARGRECSDRPSIAMRHGVLRIGPPAE